MHQAQKRINNLEHFKMMHLDAGQTLASRRWRSCARSGAPRTTNKTSWKNSFWIGNSSKAPCAATLRPRGWTFTCKKSLMRVEINHNNNVDAEMIRSRLLTTNMCNYGTPFRWIAPRLRDKLLQDGRLEHPSPHLKQAPHWAFIVQMPAPRLVRADVLWGHQVHQALTEGANGPRDKVFTNITKVRR